MQNNYFHDIDMQKRTMKSDTTIAEQTQRYAGMVTRALPQAAIEELRSFAAEALPHQVYTSYSDVPFIYEILSKEGCANIVRPLAQRWVEVGICHNLQVLHWR